MRIIQGIRFSPRFVMIPVVVRRRIRMEPQRVSTVLILIVISGFAGMVSSLCLVKKAPTTKAYLYQCFMSDDYFEDVGKAPIDMQRVCFTNSKIPVVKDRSFVRLSKYLERLAVFHSEVEDIEDEAFQGLTKLDLLAFPGNKLRVIKSAWFEGLVNLKDVSFQSNRIKHLDSAFFSTLPPLELLDITRNEITCLPTASFGNLKVKEFGFTYNRLTPMCQFELMKWLDDRNIKYNQHEIDYLDTQYEVTKICVDKLPKSQMNENTLNKCIESTTHELLPAKGNYTVKQLCELLKDTPSPFLNCNK